MSSASKLLRKWYGLDNDGNSDETRDMDSPNFQPKKFFEEKVQKDSVPNLLALENSIVSEIRSYDNDLQTLVYDNYTKFLGAADTIHSLSSNIVGLKSKISTLKENVNQLHEHGDQYNNKLDFNRQKVNRLFGISRLLERVEFISTLPELLKEYSKNEKFSSAVNIWVKVEGILSSQQHFPSFARIHAECSEIMEQIKSQIRAQMLNTDIPVPESVEYGSLLIKLNTSPTLICSQLGHHRYLVIDNTLEYDEDIPTDPFKALEALDKLVIQDAVLFISLFKQKFINTEEDPEIKSQIARSLSLFQSNTYNRIIQFVESSSTENFTAEEMVNYLNKVCALLQPIAMPDQLSCTVRKMLQRYSELAAGKVSNRFSDGLAGALSEDVAAAEKLFARLVDDVVSLAADFNAFLAAGRRECSHYLSKEAAALFEGAFKKCKDSDSSYGLALGIALSKLAGDGISRAFDALLALDADLPDVSGTLADECRSAAAACLKKFIKHKRASIDAALLSGAWPWALDTAPNSASEAASRLISTLEKLHASLKCLEEEAEETTEWRPPTSPYKASLFQQNEPTFAGVRDEGLVIERMFTMTNRLHLGRPVDFEAPQIMGSVAMYTLKTALEICRSGSFSPEGFNQMQIDMYFIYSFLKEKVDQTELLGSLIEEIMCSAADRTFGATPLEVSTLSSIYEHYSR